MKSILFSLLLLLLGSFSISLEIKDAESLKSALSIYDKNATKNLSLSEAVGIIDTYSDVPIWNLENTDIATNLLKHVECENTKNFSQILHICADIVQQLNFYSDKNNVSSLKYTYPLKHKFDEMMGCAAEQDEEFAFNSSGVVATLQKIDTRYADPNLKVSLANTTEILLNEPMIQGLKLASNYGHIFAYLSAWDPSTNPFKRELNEKKNFFSPILSIQFFLESGSLYPVQNLVVPLEISLPLPKHDNNTKLSKVSCATFNDDVRYWDDAGISTLKQNDTHLVCATSHLSDFAGLEYINKFQLPDGYLPLPFALMIATCVYLTVFFIILVISDIRIRRQLKKKKASIPANDVEKQAVKPKP